MIQVMTLIRPFTTPQIHHVELRPGQRQERGERRELSTEDGPAERHQQGSVQAGTRGRQRCQRVFQVGVPSHRGGGVPLIWKSLELMCVLREGEMVTNEVLSDVKVPKPNAPIIIRSGSVAGHAITLALFG